MHKVADDCERGSVMNPKTGGFVTWPHHVVILGVPNNGWTSYGKWNKFPNVWHNLANMLHTKCLGFKYYLFHLIEDIFSRGSVHC